MKGVAVLLVFLIFAGCKDGGSSASDTCEQALRTASKHVPMLQDQKELAQAVGDCINKQWPVETRKCVAAARDRPDLVACLMRLEEHAGSGSQAKPVDTTDDRAAVAEAMDRMQKFADEMCTCTDTNCAQRVSDDMTKWAQEQASSQKPAPKMNPDDLKRAQAIGTRMGECMQRAMTAK